MKFVISFFIWQYLSIPSTSMSNTAKVTTKTITSFFNIQSINNMMRTKLIPFWLSPRIHYYTQFITFKFIRFKSCYNSK